MLSCGEEKYYALYRIGKVRSEVAMHYFQGKTKPLKTYYGCQNHHPLWYIPPVDLTPRLYTCPKKDRIKTNVAKKKKEIEFLLPKFCLPKLCQVNSEKSNKMITHFRALTANTDRRSTLKTGYHEKQRYSQPRPRHFGDDIHRPLDDNKLHNKEEIQVKHKQDSFNEKFKNEDLKYKDEQLSLKANHGTTLSKKIDCQMDVPLKFDSKLYLPKTVELCKTVRR
ncbi:uncharacterized protein LOC130622307 isoform X2 [Hydractinia symbiolongicarpus]|uniref:uncharacterized protein LOC130622307 isoform X2 n=1 Tax=Hydractinia symbiolongicarpus TaxID=13093 RepID=UPI00254B0EC4|nr:uncharacterized protein LOC130622307 isoform X2 [Hydractinia symbiolongicarpus]